MPIIHFHPFTVCFAPEPPHRRCHSEDTAWLHHGHYLRQKRDARHSWNGKNRGLGLNQELSTA